METMQKEMDLAYDDIARINTTRDSRGVATKD